MAILAVATVKIKDPGKFREYGGKAKETLTAFNGTVVERGKFTQTLAGDTSSDVIGIMSFPDLKSATDWYNSEEYQAIIPLREEASDMTITLYEQLS